MNIKDKIIDAHHMLYGAPKIMVSAPGRVNIIGMHTDYNGKQNNDVLGARMRGGGFRGSI